VSDDFDINALRERLKSAGEPPKTKSARPVDAIFNPPPTDALSGAGEAPLFDWSGIPSAREAVAGSVEPSEPLMPRDWPPISSVPVSPSNRARPFGRRNGGAEQVMNLETQVQTDLFGPREKLDDQVAEVLMARADRIRKAVDAKSSPRRVDPFSYEPPEIPPDPRPDEAEFSDLITPEDLAAAEHAAESLRQSIALSTAKSQPLPRRVRDPRTAAAEKLLLSLANTIALERDRLEARRSDLQAPLILTPLRRRKTDRQPSGGNTLDLFTANDRM